MKRKMKTLLALVLSVLLAVSLLLLAGTAAETGYCYKSGGNKSFFHCMKMFFVYGAGAGSRRQRASPVKRVPKRGLKLSGTVKPSAGTALPVRSSSSTPAIR